MTITPKASSLTSFCSALVLFALAGAAIPALAEEPAPRHGIAMHGEPKYPEGFSHFDYVNPDAPKGGSLELAVVSNGFDSFNPFA